MEEADFTLYQFVLKQFFLSNVNIVTMIVIGLLTDQLPAVVCFLLFFIPLRTSAGGYHCSTPLRCYLSSVVIVSLLMVLNKYYSILILICGMISFPIIWIYAPLESNNNPLELWEKAKYATKTKVLLLIYAILLGITSVFGMNFLVDGIGMATTMVGVLLILSMISSVIGKD